LTSKSQGCYRISTKAKQYTIEEQVLVYLKPLQFYGV